MNNIQYVGNKAVLLSIASECLLFWRELIKCRCVRMHGIRVWWGRYVPPPLSPATADF